MTTSTDIVNEALQLIGDNQPPVTGVAPGFDTSTAGKAAALLYGSVVAAVGRQFEWDFARKTVALALTANTAPYPWTYEYSYPSNGIEVWQLLPGSETDPNNPLPYNFAVGNAIVSGAQARVIWTNLASAYCTYNNNPNENTWDALFHQAVVRLLASGLSMALAGKPDLANLMIQSGAAFETIGEQRDN